MTVIAWDGRALAADKRTTDAGMARTTTKIERAPDRSLVGAAGNTARCKALIEWVCQGALPARWNNDWNGAHILHIHTNGKVVAYDGGPHPIEYHDQFVAIGSGRDFATAAMALGQNAYCAVELACRFDVHCGNGIDVLVLHPASPTAF